MGQPRHASLAPLRDRFYADDYVEGFQKTPALFESQNGIP